MRLSQDVEITLSVALSEAARLGHEYAGVEHLLLALAIDDDTARVLRHAGAPVETLRAGLEAWLAQEVPSAGAAGGEEVPREPRLSLALQRTLARAAAQVEASGREEVAGRDLLVALFAETGSAAVALLAEHGVSRLDVVRYIAHGVSRLEPSIPGAAPRPAGGGGPGDTAAGEEDDEAAEPAPEGDEALAAFTQDLTDLARRGLLDPLVGREREVTRTLQVLQRRRKNNPLYVGDPGVGKTALVEGLAVRIAAGDVPEPFAAARIHRLDLGALIAGTRYRGDFENRVKAVLAALAVLDRPVLFIDEIHTLVGAGSAGRGTMDASNLLKPALQAGTLRCIGATTWEELKTFQRDPALARRFQVVEVDEPSLEETVKILRGLAGRYEEHHGVTLTRAALATAAELADRHLHDRRLPDKAIDLVDEAAAAVALAGRRRVGTGDVERVLATMARIPEQRVHGDDRERLAGLGARLREVVFGQDAAVDRLVASIKVARAGLREGQRPVGAFLLTGPTGVGKTEMARRLADALGIGFLRYDMSEYMERHTVSRLVGAPPGYVGFDRGGLLTDAVARQPHAVLLLDEIEKAHPDVFNLLLQVMDHGTLTDANGRRTDFRHVILLMTSNVGARELEHRAPGFAGGAAGEAAGPTAGEGARAADAERALERLFSPEFRNRLDAVLRFRSLSPQVMERIVDKMVGELAAQLAGRKVRLVLTPAARRLLAARGHDPAMGARPLARVIDETIKRPLTDELLFGRLAGGGEVTVDVAPAAPEAGDAKAAELVLRYGG